VFEWKKNKKTSTTTQLFLLNLKVDEHLFCYLIIWLVAIYLLALFLVATTRTDIIRTDLQSIFGS